MCALPSSARPPDEELDAALADLHKKNDAPLKGLVLDLRNNPGGVLEAAVAVADEFLDSGVIVSAKGRTPESKFEMQRDAGRCADGAPIVVLVDGGSASASEIVAGALKDNHRATLMGRTTFGKGSVQTVLPLGDDRALKLTTSLYYTPSGVSINHRGIAPDIELERDSQGADARTRAGCAAYRARFRGQAGHSGAQGADRERSRLALRRPGLTVRSTQSIEILCLALAALVLVWSGTLVAQPWAAVPLVAFAAAIFTFRARRFFPGRTRTRLSIESWSMVAFVTAVLWFTDKSSSPLFNLYLLPIILSALTLGRLVTLLQVGVIALCHLLLASASPADRCPVARLCEPGRRADRAVPAGRLSHHHALRGHHRGARAHREPGAERRAHRAL